MGLPDKASDVISTLSPLEKIVLHNQYLLHEHSSYTFKEGDRYMLSSSSDLTNSYGVIESRLLQGDIVPSDFFIAYAIAMVGTTDLEVLTAYMKWMHNAYPDKIIPYNISTTSLRTRLEKLARAGVIRCFSIVREGEGKKGYFYGISELGAKAVRRRLDIAFLSYDTWPLVDCEQRVWRRLAANRLGAALLTLNKKEPPKFYTELYDKDYKAKVPVYVRHQCEYTDSEGKLCKAFLIVEPVSFVTNKLLKTDEEVLSDVKKRIKTLMSRIDIARGNGAETRNSADVCDTAILLFVADDVDAIKRTAAIVYEYSATALDNCLFTTERIIAGNKGKLCRCFFSAKATQKEDGSIVVKPAYDVSHSELFGKDDYTESGLKGEHLVKLGLAVSAE